MHCNNIPSHRKNQDTSGLSKLGFTDTYLIVDCSDYEIQRPTNRYARKVTYSGKDKQHQIKYLVAVLATTGDIVYCSRAFPGMKLISLLY